MALPLIAAGIAARAVAKKLATRAVGGITGTGAKFVGTEYRNMNTGSVKVGKFRESESRLSFADSMKLNLKDSANSVGSYNQGLRSAGKVPKIKINSGNTRAR
jgi:hypothetical protein